MIQLFWILLVSYANYGFWSETVWETDIFRKPSDISNYSYLENTVKHSI